MVLCTVDMGQCALTPFRLFATWGNQFELLWIFGGYFDCQKLSRNGYTLALCLTGSTSTELWLKRCWCGEQAE